MRQRVAGGKRVGKLGVEPAPSDDGLCGLFREPTTVPHDGHQIMRRRAGRAMSGSIPSREGRETLASTQGESAVGPDNP